jgi:hypothetical protein
MADAFIKSTVKQSWKDIENFKEFIEKDHAGRMSQST